MAGFFTSLFGFGRRKDADLPVGPVKKEARSYTLTDPLFWSYFNLNQKSLAGVDVTQQTAMGVPPFFAACRWIAEGVSMLDRRVKVRRSDGVYDADDHPVWLLMNGSPHPYYSWFDLISALLANACLGNGYALIHWDESTMRPYALEHIPSVSCRPEYDTLGNLTYFISGDFGGRSVVRRVPYTDMIHIKGFSLDGIMGLSTTITHKSTLSTGIARQQYSESVLGKSARPSIAIKTEESLTKDEVAQMEQNVMARIGGSENAGRPLILDAGQEIQYVQWSPLEAALEALANLNIEDVCRITKVPRDLLALDTHGTYGAGVQRSKDFLTHCLNPWIEKIQDEFNRKLFWSSESRGGRYRFEFDTSMYISLDEKSKSEKLAQEVAGTIKTPNEARAELGLQPLPGGDELLVDINLLPVSRAAEIALAKYLSSAGEKLQGEAAQNNTDNETESESAN